MFHSAQKNTRRCCESNRRVVNENDHTKFTQFSVIKHL